MNVYFISGLGADSRVFRNIQLPPHCHAIPIDWITPLKKETLTDYAGRMAEKINTAQSFALVGLSMGGMIAAEIAKQAKPQATILISSIPAVQQLPPYFHLARILRLQTVVPIKLIKNFSLLKRLFTTETTDEKRLLRAMIRDSDATFIRWSMNAILTWKNKEIPKNIIHIHGTKDLVLPVRFSRPTHIITGGGHLMVLNRAAEINQVLQEVLCNQSQPVSY